MQISLFAVRPIPSICEGSIEFLETYFEENENPKVLEFGSGASTVWMAKRTTNLYSLEHH
jgi:predicted O-methyltransferase YrrM